MRLVQFWDAERAAPVLRKFAESEEGQALIKGKTAVVPGCGCGANSGAVRQWTARREAMDCAALE